MLSVSLLNCSLPTFWLQSPEHPNTPPQAPLNKPPSSILRSQTSAVPPVRQASSRYAKGNPKTSTTGPSKAITYTRHHFGASTSVATKVNSGTTATRYISGASPLVGKRADLQEKVKHYREHRQDDMVQKLEKLPHFSGWRPILGRHMLALRFAACCALLLHLPCCMGYVCLLLTLICTTGIMVWLPPGEAAVVAHPVIEPMQLGILVSFLPVL